VSKGFLSGKTALVTGGTRGIGRAISLELARQGARVIAIYARDRKSAEAFQASDDVKATGSEIECLRADLTDDELFKAAVASLKEIAPRLDIVVHSAASGVHKAAMDLSARHMKWTFDINLFAIHNLLRELSPQIPEGGRIIGITSSGGTRVLPHYAAVGASKGALESLFRHYAVELAPRGIAVNLVSPGMVLTDAVDAFPDSEARVQKSLGETPTGKLTSAAQVGGLVAFLCSEAAGQIVGQTIVMDGGRSVPS